MQIRVYYEDTDSGGVVYYANYLKLFERAKTEYLRERGFSVSENARQGTSFPVVHLEVNYLAPALLDDLITVETEVINIGHASFALAHRILNSQEKLLVEGQVKLACVDKSKKAKRLPTELIKALQNTLG